MLFLTTSFVFGQTPVQNALTNFANSPEFANASISFYAIDLSSGEKIAEYNPFNSLPPASTVKLFSTATSIEVLGPKFRPSTRLYIDGKIDSQGILQGNLWIRGGGDPTLGSEYFTDKGKESQFIERWTDTISKLGIKSINGKIIADASEFGYNGIPDGWSWSDMGNYYGAGPSGIVLYDNALKLQFKTGNYVGSPTTLTSTFPQVPGLDFQNYITSAKGGGDNSYIYGAPFSLNRFGTGTLPMNTSSFQVKGSLPDPEFQLAFEINESLLRKGIQTKGIQSHRTMNPGESKGRYGIGFNLIYTQLGETIESISSITNHKSINLFAEELLCLTSHNKTGNGSTDAGLDFLDKYWKDKIDTKGLYLKDGSGLSRTNAVSAYHYCSLLKYMSSSKYAKEFYNTLPISGESGTLRSVCRGQVGHGKIHAKSGTMSRIKSYAGYIESSTGKQIAFAFIVNNYNCSTSVVVDKMERIFNLLSQY